MTEQPTSLSAAWPRWGCLYMFWLLGGFFGCGIAFSVALVQFDAAGVVDPRTFWGGDGREVFEGTIQLPKSGPRLVSPIDQRPVVSLDLIVQRNEHRGTKPVRELGHVVHNVPFVLKCAGQAYAVAPDGLVVIHPTATKRMAPIHEVPSWASEVTEAQGKGDYLIDVQTVEVGKTVTLVGRAHSSPDGVVIGPGAGGRLLLFAGRAANNRAALETAWKWVAGAMGYIGLWVGSIVHVARRSRRSASSPTHE